MTSNVAQEAEVQLDSFLTRVSTAEPWSAIREGILTWAEPVETATTA